MSGPTRFCAVATKNRLAHARVLTDSILLHHPKARVDVLLVDPPAGFDPGRERFKTLRLDDLRIPGLKTLAFKYTAQQFCGLLKAWTLRRLLDEGAPHAVYLDVTALVTAGLGTVSRLLKEHPILVSPHLTSPLPDDGKTKSDLDMLCSGPYNSGFVAVRAGAASRAFLEWWSERTRDHCMPERGSRSNDQKWLALAPSLFSGVGILRAPGHNLAYWNIHDLTLSRKSGRWFFGGALCRFFFFSGYDPRRPDAATRYLNDRLRLSERADLRAFFDSYRRALLARGYETLSRRPYAFEAFDNGVRVDGLMRRLYREAPRPERFGDPFRTGPASFYRWLGRPVSGVPRLWAEIYREHEVLRRRFPDAFGRGRRAYLSWAGTQGVGALGLSEALAPPTAI